MIAGKEVSVSRKASRLAVSGLLLSVIRNSCMWKQSLRALQSPGRTILDFFQASLASKRPRAIEQGLVNAFYVAFSLCRNEDMCSQT